MKYYNIFLITLSTLINRWKKTLVISGAVFSDLAENSSAVFLSPLASLWLANTLGISGIKRIIITKSSIRPLSPCEAVLIHYVLNALFYEIAFLHHKDFLLFLKSASLCNYYKIYVVQWNDIYRSQSTAQLTPFTTAQYQLNYVYEHT